MRFWGVLAMKGPIPGDSGLYVSLPCFAGKTVPGTVHWEEQKLRSLRVWPGSGHHGSPWNRPRSCSRCPLPREALSLPRNRNLHWDVEPCPPSAMTRLHGSKSGDSTSSLCGHHCQFQCAGLGQRLRDPRGVCATSPMMARAVLPRAHARVHLASPRSHLGISPSHWYKSLGIPAQNSPSSDSKTGVFPEK